MVKLNSNFITLIYVYSSVYVFVRSRVCVCKGAMYMEEIGRASCRERV